MSETNQTGPIAAIRRCESCGAPATVTLDDGSAWCESCDVAARCLEAIDRPHRHPR